MRYREADMKEILLKTPSLEGRIFIGEESLERIPALAQSQKNFVITDETVRALYPKFFEEYFPNTEIFVMKTGEEHKNFQTLSVLLEKMLESGLQRTSRVFAVGGGVVGDVAGLASSLYMRGISLVQIPTTLLSQIDSSVGGKTAVNHGGVKNSVGAFYQPFEVLIAPSFLKTLPEKELKSGIGELVKYAALDKGIYRTLQENKSRLQTLDLSYLTDLIIRAVELKAQVVAKDEKENGDRKSLNIGHTTGHAIELAFSLSHGESVLYGMALETLIAINKGVCERAYGESLLSIVKSALSISSITKLSLKSVEELTKKASQDKKNLGDGKIVMSVAKSEGEWTLLSLSYEEYEQELRLASEEFTL